MTQDKAESQFAELDEQIRAALQVEAPADQLGRLQEYWRQQSQIDQRRRTVRRVVALAAVVLVALVASWRQWRPIARMPSPPDAAANAAPVPTATRDQVAQHQQAAVQDPGDEPSISQGRPATAYEQLVFTMRLRQRESVTQRAAVDAVENLIARVVRDPKMDVQQLLQSADMKSVPVEPLLLRQLHRGNESRQRAILQLLAACGTSRSTVPLLQLSRRTDLREQSLQTLEQLVGLEGLAQAVAQTADPSVRATVYRRLWKDLDALDVCLSLVRNPLFRDEVLATVDDVAQPMLEALLARLAAEDADVRLAAALVLGHANGPVITQSLIGVVSENPACNAETWIALMACRGPQSDQFLAFATGQPRLLGSLNRARVYWARITN